MTNRKFLWSSIALAYILLAVILLTRSSVPSAPASDLVASDAYTLQTGLYPLYHIRQANIVMLGDSLTYFVDWPNLLGRSDVANRAIPGDTTIGALDRLDEVISLHPRIVVILLGTNDLFYRDAAATYTNYQRILSALSDNNITPVIVTLPPFADSHSLAATFNPQIAELNTLLTAYATNHHLYLIDLHAVIMAHPDWLANDGIHLTAPAYAAWRDLLNSQIGAHRPDNRR